ncbi:hypothetical protein MASR2M79_25020 [Aminivibrio sp.]
MNKMISLEDAVNKIQDGMTVMVGGISGVRHASSYNRQAGGKRDEESYADLQRYSFPEVGVGKLVVNKQFKKVIVSHIGTNPETGRQMHDEEIEVVLVPQGT